jgi:hypothetical protein
LRISNCSPLQRQLPSIPFSNCSPLEAPPSALSSRAKGSAVQRASRGNVFRSRETVSQLSAAASAIPHKIIFVSASELNGPKWHLYRRRKNICRLRKAPIVVARGFPRRILRIVVPVPPFRVLFPAGASLAAQRIHAGPLNLGGLARSLVATQSTIGECKWGLIRLVRLIRTFLGVQGVLNSLSSLNSHISGGTISSA